MGDIVQFRHAVERICDRHKPGKLVGLYRSLRRSHAASETGGWTSVSLLTAGIVNQMLHSGSQLWWDMVDLDYSSLAIPDSSRDEIGIRTLAGQVEYGVNSQCFITTTCVRINTGIRQVDPTAMSFDKVNLAVAEAARNAGVPPGGFFPMFAHMGDAVREANLHVHRISQEGNSLKLRLWDEKEYEENAGVVTNYDIRINFINLLKDIDTIRASLANLN